MATGKSRFPTKATRASRDASAWSCERTSTRAQLLVVHRHATQEDPAHACRAAHVDRGAVSGLLVAALRPS